MYLLSESHRPHFYDGKTWLDASEDGFYAFRNISAGKNISDTWAVSLISTISKYNWQDLKKRKHHTWTDYYRDHNNNFTSGQSKDNNYKWLSKSKDSDDIWFATLDNTVYHSTDKLSSYKSIPPSNQQVYCGGANNTIAYDTKGNLYKWTGSKWKKLTSNTIEKVTVKAAAADEHGNIFVLSNTDDIWAFFIKDYPTRYNAYKEITKLTYKESYKKLQTAAKNIKKMQKALSTLDPELQKSISTKIANVTKNTRSTAYPLSNPTSGTLVAVDNAIKKATAALNDRAYSKIDSFITPHIKKIMHLAKNTIEKLETYVIKTIFQKSFTDFVTNIIKIIPTQKDITSITQTAQKITNQSVKKQISDLIGYAQKDLSQDVSPYVKKANDALKIANKNLITNNIDKALTQYINVTNQIKIARNNTKDVLIYLNKAKTLIGEHTLRLTSLNEEFGNLKAEAISLTNMINDAQKIRNKSAFERTIKNTEKKFKTIQDNLDTANQKLTSGNLKGTIFYINKVKDSMETIKKDFDRIKRQIQKSKKQLIHHH
jgi:hypothetical protein